jgi:hypothetical protein
MRTVALLSKLLRQTKRYTSASLAILQHSGCSSLSNQVWPQQQRDRSGAHSLAIVPVANHGGRLGAASRCGHSAGSLIVGLRD